MIDLAVIFAVGNPIHQSQLIYNRPRAMLPALGKPLVVRVMERLYRAGIQNYVVVVGEDEGGVAAYLNTQWLPNVSLEFVVQPFHSTVTRTLATIARGHNKPFIVTTYNTFIHANFPERLLKYYKELGDGLVLSGAPATLSKSDPGVFAALEGQKVTAILRNPPPGQRKLLLTNLAVCGPGFVQYVSSLSLGTRPLSRQLMDALRLYVESGGMTSVVEANWMLQVESDYDLLTANKLLLDDEQDTHILSEIPGTVQIIPPVRIDPQVTVGRGAKIGPRVYLESGCGVGQNAVVSNSIILQGAFVPTGSRVSESVVSAYGFITP